MQKQGHKEKIEGRDICVLREERLKNQEPGEMAGIPVNLPDRGSPSGTPAHIESWRRKVGRELATKFPTVGRTCLSRTHTSVAACSQQPPSLVWLPIRIQVLTESRESQIRVYERFSW